MPEWLRDSFQGDVDVSLRDLTIRLSVACAFGCIVGGIYRLTHGKADSQSASFLATLVLLTVLIAMVTLAIGNNIARAFSLVGALAIVRFRTVVEDTRDTAFVIFAVAVGLAVGAGSLAIPLVGIPFVAVSAFLFRRRDEDIAPPANAFTLKLRVGIGHSPDDLLRGLFAKHLEGADLLSVATARQGAAFDLSYAVRLRNAEGALALIAELNGLESVQDVELRR